MDQSGYVCRGMNKRLYEAAKLGDIKVVNEIGDLQGIVNELTPGGNTVLHIAVFHGSPHFLQKLLQLLIVDPEDGMTFLRAKNMEGNTTLHKEALGGKDVVKALLQSCPHLVNEINLEGETPLFKASKGGHLMIFDMLCPLPSSEYNKRFDGQTTLHLSVSNLRRGMFFFQLLDKCLVSLNF